jgi:hypothetical protein
MSGAVDLRSQLWTQASSMTHWGSVGLARLEEGRPLVEVQMLQLKDDRNVRADSDRGIEGDDRSCKNIPKGTRWC